MGNCLSRRHVVIAAARPAREGEPYTPVGDRISIVTELYNDLEPYHYVTGDDASGRRADDDRSTLSASAADDSVDATPIFSEPRNDSPYFDDVSYFSGEDSWIPEQITADFDDADSYDEFPEFRDYSAYYPTNVESCAAFNDVREVRSFTNPAVLCSMLLTLLVAWFMASFVV